MTPARQGHLAMLAFSALVAGSFSLGSLTAPHVDPAAFTALRFALAAAVVGAMAAATGGMRRAHFRAPWRYLLLGGLFGAYFVLMFEGLKTATPVSAAAVFTLTPLVAALAGYVVLRQVTTPRMALALVIGAAGACWVIFRADLDALLAFEVGRGEAVYFVGCVCHAVYIPLLRRLNRGEPALVFTLGTTIGGGLLIALWAAPELVSTDWAALPGVVWVTLVYVSVFASAATFVLAQFASMRLPAAKVMAYTYLTPSWVILWEIALGHAVPPLLVLVGVALTVVALVLLLKDEDGQRGTGGERVALS